MWREWREEPLKKKIKQEVQSLKRQEYVKNKNKTKLSKKRKERE